MSASANIRAGRAYVEVTAETSKLRANLNAAQSQLRDFGEALVLTNEAPKAHFRWHMKQRGAVLAKGRLLGVQFQALLEDNRFFDAARHANELAFRLRDGITALGYPFPVASPTNQQFPVLPNTVMAQLEPMLATTQPQRADSLPRFCLM